MTLGSPHGRPTKANGKRIGVSLVSSSPTIEKRGASPTERAEDQRRVGVRREERVGLSLLPPLPSLSLSLSLSFVRDSVALSGNVVQLWKALADDLGVRYTAAIFHSSLQATYRPLEPLNFWSLASIVNCPSRCVVVFVGGLPVGGRVGLLSGELL